MQPIISLAKIASVGLLSATAAGVGVLTWAAITTQGDEPTDPAPQAEAQTSNTPTPPPFSPTQTPPPGSRFTADQAIVYATRFSDAEDVSQVEATLMTYAEAREFTKNSTIFPNEPDPDSPTWLLAFTGRFHTWMLRDLSATGSPTAAPLCTIEYIYLVEDPLAPVGSAVRADSCTEPDTIPREVAIFNAVRYASSTLTYETPPLVSAELMAAPDALPLVDERFSLIQPAYSFPPADDVWVVAFAGSFKWHALSLLELSTERGPGHPTPSPPPPTPASTRAPATTHALIPPSFPAPTTTPTPTPTGSACAEIVIIITAEGDPVLGWYYPRDDCTSQEPEAQPPITEPTPPHFAVTTLTPTPSLIPPSTEHDFPIPTNTFTPLPSLTSPFPIDPSPTPTVTPLVDPAPTP